MGNTNDQPGRLAGDHQNCNPESDATDKSWRDGMLAQLGNRLALCSRDELRVIDVFVGRLEGGREEYGQLDLSKPRDWPLEKAQERFDWQFYDACEVLVDRDAKVAAIVERVEPETSIAIDTRLRDALNADPLLAVFCKCETPNIVRSEMAGEIDRCTVCGGFDGEGR